MFSHKIMLVLTIIDQMVVSPFIVPPTRAFFVYVTRNSRLTHFSWGSRWFFDSKTELGKILIIIPANKHNMKDHTSNQNKRAQSSSQKHFCQDIIYLVCKQDFLKKLIFLTPWYANIRNRLTGYEMLFFFGNLAYIPYGWSLKSIRKTL